MLQRLKTNAKSKTKQKLFLFFILKIIITLTTMINGVLLFLYVCFWCHRSSGLDVNCNIFVWTNRETVTFTNDFLKINETFCLATG